MLNKNTRNTPIAIIKELSDEERERLIIEEKEKMERDEKSKLVYAYQNGSKKAAYEIAPKLLIRGLDTNLVSEVTGLTYEEVETLKTTLNNRNYKQ